jgi:hypothetical protein
MGLKVRQLIGIPPFAPLTADDLSDSYRPVMGGILDATLGEVRNGPREVVEGPITNVTHLR